MIRLRTLIVDDEPLALKLIRKHLDKIPEIEIIAECKNGREAFDATMDLSPDLMFLDIQMPGMNGFDVVQKLQADVVPLVVFTTAYEQYALDAFDVHAVDYILKPLDINHLQRAVDRALERFSRGEDDFQKNRIIGAIDDINNKISQDSPANQQTTVLQSNNHNIERKIVIKDRDVITLLKQNDIEWVDAAGDYVCLHAEGVTHIKRSTLKDLLAELDDNIFKRVHRSTIVNLNHIEKVIPHSKGEFFLQLSEFERIKVSRNYREVIKSFLSET
ncbi:MAG: two-component system LytT family response regulator [Paraglaciecola sp.]|jgi:two-component system LytT family response regulator